MRIKEIIKEKGMTVNEVAEKMGIKQPSLSRAINGNPTKDMLYKIAEALDVEISDLFERENPVVACPHCGKAINIKIDIEK